MPSLVTPRVTETLTAPDLDKEPINNIQWLLAGLLHANAWNPNLVFTAELRLLEHSILTTGWIQPVLVSPNDGQRGYMVIDGFHRWMLSKEKALHARYNGFLPCVVLDLPVAQAMMLTVRINRAKGSHAAVRMAALVKELLDVHGLSREEVAKGIGAGLDEVDLLHQDSIFKARNLKDYRYSKAWVPAEDGLTKEERASKTAADSALDGAGGGPVPGDGVGSSDGVTRALDEGDG